MWFSIRTDCAPQFLTSLPPVHTTHSTAQPKLRTQYPHMPFSTDQTPCIVLRLQIASLWLHGEQTLNGTAQSVQWLCYRPDGLTSHTSWRPQLHAFPHSSRSDFGILNTTPICNRHSFGARRVAYVARRIVSCTALRVTAELLTVLNP